MEEVRKGQARRWGHRGLEARRVLALDKAEKDRVLRALAALLAPVEATCWRPVLWRRAAESWVERKRREDSCLDMLLDDHRRVRDKADGCNAMVEDLGNALQTECVA